MAVTQTNTVSKKKSLWKNIISRHLHAFSVSISRIIHAPLATILTIAVIGIALAMPLGLFALLQNIQNVGQGFNDGAQVSLYLKSSVTQEQAQELVQELQGNKDIASARYISPAEGLKVFAKQSGFSDALAQLDSNPLPAVIVLHPNASLQTPVQIEAFLQRLQQIPEVDSAQLDMLWVKRLFAIINLGHRIVLALGILFGLAVLLVIGNTIRLSVQNHRNEIEVVKLVGATDSFIRRPFLYNGVIYGIIGGLLAYILMNIFLFSLQLPVNRIAGLYQSNFSIRTLDVTSTVILLLLSCVLGWLGSWIAVGRQLNRIQPE